jgi:hypothetical protein
MRRQRWVLIAVLIVICVRPTLADEKASRLVELIDAGQIPSPQALEKASKLRDSLVKEQGGSTELDYAYTLVLMRQRKYDDAIQLLGGLIKSEPKNFPAHRARIWSEMTLKKYSAAMLDMLSAASSLGKATTPEEKIEAVDTAEFLGRAWAFLSGPAAAANKGTNFDRERDKLLATMNDEQQSAFQLGRSHVATLFAKMTLDRDEAVAATKADAEKQLAADAKHLQDEKTELKQDKEALSQRSEKKEAQTKESIDKIDKVGQSAEDRLASLRSAGSILASQLQVVQARANAEFAEAQSLAAQAQQLQAEANNADRNRNSSLASSLRSQASTAQMAAAQAASFGYAANATAQPLWSQLNAMQVQAYDLTGKRDALLGEKSRLLDKSQREADRLASEEEALKKQYKAADQKEHALAAKKISGVSGRVLSLGNQLKAFSTYQPFPFDMERERLVRGTN